MESEFLSKHNLNYLQIFPVQGDHFSFSELHPFESSGIVQDVVVNLGMERIGQIPLLILLDILRELRFRPRAIHLHHLWGWDLISIQKLHIIFESVPVVVFIHDYYTLCHSLNLLRKEGDCCQGPSVESERCRSCEFGSKRREHFSKIASLFRGIKTKSRLSFVTPSSVSAAIWRSAYPEYKDLLTIVPHKKCVASEPPSDFSSQQRRVLRVAFLGNPVAIKGYYAWIKATQDLRVRQTVWGIPLALQRGFMGGIINCFSKLIVHEFHVFGRCVTLEKLGLWHFWHGSLQLYQLGSRLIHQRHVREVPVSFIKDGQAAMIDALRRNQIDVAILCSSWAETYCFTAVEALEGGALIVTVPESGNIAALVNSKPNYGLILHDAGELAEILISPRLREAVQKRRSLPSPVFQWNSQFIDEMYAN
jgi:hypothetical protein